MKITFLIFVLAVIMVVNAKAQLADSPWPMFRGNLQHTGWSPYDTSDVDGTVKWIFKADDDFESSPTIGADGTIYLGSHKNKVYAINSDGTLKWKFDAGEPVYDPIYDVWKGILSTPAISEDGTIYITSLSNFLFALSPDGTEKWKFPMKTSISTWSSPAIGVDGTIYVGSARSGSGGKIYAINPEGKEKWSFQAKSDVFPTPAIGEDGTIYIGSGSVGDFYAIKPDGNLKWMFNTGKHIETSAAIGADGTIYVGSWNNKFYAFTPDGRKKWEFLTKGEGLVASPAIGKDGTIYLSANDKNLYALNPDGTEKWRLLIGAGVETPSSPTIGADGTIYLGIPYEAEGKPTFFAIDPGGTKKWSIATKGGISASPAIGKNGTVYISSYNGEVYAISRSSAMKENESKGILAVEIWNQTPVEKKGDEKVNAEVKTFCGNNICEPPAETSETCGDDCCLSPGCGKPKEDFKKENISEKGTVLIPENEVILNEVDLIKEDKTSLKENRESGIFEKIINFLRSLFK